MRVPYNWWAFVTSSAILNEHRTALLACCVANRRHGVLVQVSALPVMQVLVQADHVGRSSSHLIRRLLHASQPVRTLRCVRFMMLDLMGRQGTGEIRRFPGFHAQTATEFPEAR
jgi:hypothetical protein